VPNMIELEAAFKVRLRPLKLRNKQAMFEVGKRLRRLRTRGTKLSPLQFDVFRRNYFYRTATTPHSVAAMIAAALQHIPPKLVVAANVLKTLDEELGATEGDSHLDLLLDCLNTVSSHNFQLPALTLEDSAKKLLISPVTIRFRERQRVIFSPRKYFQILGASFGQEGAADGMLRMLKQSLFVPLLKGVPATEHAKVMRYFDAHISTSSEQREIEKEHASRAWSNIKEYLRDPLAANAIFAGAKLGLELQSEFFLSLVESMESHTDGLHE
jgi:hypothetical protein